MPRWFYDDHLECCCLREESESWLAVSEVGEARSRGKGFRESLKVELDM